MAHGVTGAPMCTGTGFLFGSVTKVLTTTLMLQQAERGNVDLDERIVTYLPEFRLTTRAAAGKLRVRNLLTHTNGIDADLFFVNAKGRDALKIFLGELGQHCGVLFGPGEYVSYSNGGMIVAGRLLEVVTGTSYHDLLKREVYATAGMADSCTSAGEAILRSTAVGHFPDPATGGTRRTGMFMLPDTWAPAGSTPIGTISDLLAFGRTHLAGGVSPSGNRVLSRESTARMQSVSYDMGTPNVPPSGSAGCSRRSGKRRCSRCQEHRPAGWLSWWPCPNTTLSLPLLATTRGRSPSMTRSCCGCCASTSRSTFQTSR